MASKSARASAPGRPIPGKKYFTVDEAKLALPYVSRIIGDLTACYRQVADFRDRMEFPEQDEDVDQIRNQFEQELERLQYLTEELNHVGVELKDYERGLIDFPALHEGREICLCWEHGEEGLVAWHEVEAGFSGRRDITQLLESSAS